METPQESRYGERRRTIRPGVGSARRTWGRHRRRYATDLCESPHNKTIAAATTRNHGHQPLKPDQGCTPNLLSADFQDSPTSPPAGHGASAAPSASSGRRAGLRGVRAKQRRVLPQSENGGLTRQPSGPTGVARRFRTGSCYRVRPPENNHQPTTATMIQIHQFDANMLELRLNSDHSLRPRRADGEHRNALTTLSSRRTFRSSRRRRCIFSRKSRGGLTPTPGWAHAGMGVAPRFVPPNATHGAALALGRNETGKQEIQDREGTQNQQPAPDPIHRLSPRDFLPLASAPPRRRGAPEAGGEC